MHAILSKVCPLPAGMAVHNGASAAAGDALLYPAQQTSHPPPVPSGMSLSLLQVRMTNMYHQGTRCYVDASTVPDQPNFAT